MLRQISNTFVHAKQVKEVTYGNYVQRGFNYSIYDIDFKKTYYAPIQGALRAIKFQSLIRDHGCDTSYICLSAKVAGIDEVMHLSEHAIYDRNVKTYVGKIYESKEDYENGDCVGTINVDNEQLFYYVFGSYFTYVYCNDRRNKWVGNAYSSYQFGAYRYKWDGTKVVIAGRDVVDRFNQRVEIFKDDSVLLGYMKTQLQDFETLFKGTYSTYEECERANQINVVDFDDEEEDTETETTYQVTLNLTINVINRIRSLGVTVEI